MAEDVELKWVNGRKAVEEEKLRVEGTIKGESRMRDTIAKQASCTTFVITKQ